MKIREHGNESPISAKSSCRVEVENQPSLDKITESEAEADQLGESIGNVARPIGPCQTVNDVDDVLAEATRTLRNEVEAIASLADGGDGASQILEDDHPALPCRDEPLDAEIALLVSGIEEELAIMSVLADTLAERLRQIVGQERSKVGKMQASRRLRSSR
jgi:hypothetical protein